MTSTGYRMTALITNGASAALPTSQMGLGSVRTVVTAIQSGLICEHALWQYNIEGYENTLLTSHANSALQKSTQRIQKQSKIECAKLLTHYLLEQLSKHVKKRENSLVFYNC